MTPTDPRTAAPASPARVPLRSPRYGPARRRRTRRSWRGLLHGAAAGAAGSTALNAVTYLDMVVRGRPASDAPEQVVRRLAGTAGIDLGGSRRERQNRSAGLGPLAGIATGVGVGALAGVLRSAGVRLPTAVGGPLLGAAAMLASDVPLAALGVSDPRRWSAADWVSDAVPHLVYGVATHATLAAASAAEEERVAPVRAPLPILLRAAALGAASGSRSTAGVTAVALASRARRPRPGGVGPGQHGRAPRSAGCSRWASWSPTSCRPRRAGSLPRPSGAGCCSAGPRRPPRRAATGTTRCCPRSSLPRPRSAPPCSATRLRGVAAQRFGSDKPGAFLEDGARRRSWAGWGRAGRRSDHGDERLGPDAGRTSDGPAGRIFLTGWEPPDQEPDTEEQHARHHEGFFGRSRAARDPRLPPGPVRRPRRLAGAARRGHAAPRHRPRGRSPSRGWSSSRRRGRGTRSTRCRRRATRATSTA